MHLPLGWFASSAWGITTTPQHTDSHPCVVYCGLHLYCFSKHVCYSYLCLMSTVLHTAHVLAMHKKFYTCWRQNTWPARGETIVRAGALASAEILALPSADGASESAYSISNFANLNEISKKLFRDCAQCLLDCNVDGAECATHNCERVQSVHRKCVPQHSK